MYAASGSSMTRTSPDGNREQLRRQGDGPASHLRIPAAPSRARNFSPANSAGVLGRISSVLTDVTRRASADSRRGGHTIGSDAPATDGRSLDVRGRWRDSPLVPGRRLDHHDGRAISGTGGHRPLTERDHEFRRIDRRHGAILSEFPTGTAISLWGEKLQKPACDELVQTFTADNRNGCCRFQCASRQSSAKTGCGTLEMAFLTRGRACSPLPLRWTRQHRSASSSRKDRRRAHVRTAAMK